MEAGVHALIWEQDTDVLSSVSCSSVPSCRWVCWFLSLKRLSAATQPCGTVPCCHTGPGPVIALGVTAQSHDSPPPRVIAPVRGLSLTQEPCTVRAVCSLRVVVFFKAGSCSRTLRSHILAHFFAPIRDTVIFPGLDCPHVMSRTWNMIWPRIRPSRVGVTGRSWGKGARSEGSRRTYTDVDC